MPQLQIHWKNLHSRCPCLVTTTQDRVKNPGGNTTTVSHKKLESWKSPKRYFRMLLKLMQFFACEVYSKFLCKRVGTHTTECTHNMEKRQILKTTKMGTFIRIETISSNIIPLNQWRCWKIPWIFFLLIMNYPCNIHFLSKSRMVMGGKRDPAD